MPATSSSQAGSITSRLVEVFASGGNTGSSIDDSVELQLDDLAAVLAPAHEPSLANGE